MLLSAVLPNVLAAVFVFFYNSVQAMPESSKGQFFLAQTIINGVFFPIGILWVEWYTLPLSRALRSLRLPKTSRPLSATNQTDLP